MKYFDNQFLFSETYLSRYIKENNKKSAAKDENLINLFTNIVDWNKEYTMGDYKDDPWEFYIDTVLDVLGFQHKDTKGNVRVLYTNPITNVEKPVAICYAIDKEEEVASIVKGKYYAYNAVKAAKENDVEWALLTNGYKWRIYNTENISPFEFYFEIDIESSIKENSVPNEAFQLFNLFFNISTYYTEDGQLKIEKIKHESDKIAETIEEFLRGKSEEILKDLCYGLKENMNKQVYSEEDRKNIYNDAIILLYRLLFFGYAESRGLLPIINDDPDYTDSFEKLCFDAKEVMNLGQLPSIKDGFEFWERLDSHLRVYVDNSYNGGLFHNQDKLILRDYRIANDHLVKCLAEISYNKDKNEKYTSKIHYKDLSVRNLGAIYEGLLEYRLFIAEERMVQRKNKNKISYIKASETILKTSDLKNIIEVGGIYLSQDAMERKETGAYYTPEDVVEYIVENTVGKRISELRQQLREKLKPYYEELTYEPTDQGKRTIQNTIDTTTLEFINEKILSLSIIDSAMGSGHFLVNAAYRVANEIVGILSDNDWKSLDEIPVDIKEWIRKVVENCIYGIDINDLSVALARLSLWLISASNDKALSFIDHHLKTGDSIIGSTKAEVKHVSDEKLIKMFDILPDAMLYHVIRKFNRIKEIGSSTKYDVEMQKAIYEQIEGELNLIKTKFDYYLSTKYAGGISDEDEYIKIMRFGSIEDFEKPEIEPLIKYARENKFFHWELEFPQVFSNGGFDIAIGNPPYVDVSVEKYKHSVITNVDTTNLFSYMIDNNLKFVKEDFKLGYIVPLSLVCSKRMTSLRNYILKKRYSNVNFLNIDSSTHPGTLFNNLILRLTILTVSNNKQTDSSSIIRTTDYIKFFARDRKYIFKTIKYTDIENNIMVENIIPKVSYDIEKTILHKILTKTKKNMSDFMSENNSDNYFFYRTLGMTYYGYAFNEPPLFKVNGVQQVSSTLKTICLNKDISKYAAICVFYSSLFYWFWTVYSDCYNFTKKDFSRLNIDLEELYKFSDEFESIYKEIEQSLYQNGEKVLYKKAKGDTEYMLFRPRYSKKVFDKVDFILGSYYGLTTDEINYLINYDIKFRVDDGD
ncbi:hypothetical protein CLHOM_30380 [Clostridium homopropionicum DSM 5847]|uniref:site-specific DNA-methyltransferase (adenine-specific) n=1 Tax=Clostridium homopropionicum DSM 5847 TaxID=1121318 RepID=A0A0L6Z724_9CLOT|nr:DNA methyltransferase [Clostridium homopropionicum]KOA18754.1 hypothetical protein CLHOM_30380 [Clostridium homopropionicum DSM 5847]SFG54879.1 hypothetical protein SAMN04488501_110175 [Clostridium homopropionicum]